MSPSKLHILEKGAPTVRPLGNTIPLKGLSDPPKNFTMLIS
jgi:hypothetical protein